MLRVLSGAAACLLLLAAPTPATTYRRLTTADLVRKAERVSCVKCESVEARVDPRTGIIFTFVRLRLLEDMKGRSPSSTVRLRIVGGRVGNRATIVAGMPAFTRGGEAVLLLGHRNRAGYPVLIQARRGVFRLRKDKQGRRYLQGRPTGLGKADLSGRMSLDAFRGAVRRLERKAAK